MLIESKRFLFLFCFALGINFSLSYRVFPLGMALMMHYCSSFNVSGLPSPASSMKPSPLSYPIVLWFALMAQKRSAQMVTVAPRHSWVSTGGGLFVLPLFERGCGRKLVFNNFVLFSIFSAMVLPFQNSLLLFSLLDGGSVCRVRWWL